MARARLTSYRDVGWFGEYPEWIRELKGRHGVYVIRSKLTGSILYVGESHSGRLYETLTRHFQSWTGIQAGPTYVRATVEVAVRVTSHPDSAWNAQNDLIRTLKPADNKWRPKDAAEPDVPF